MKPDLGKTGFEPKLVEKIRDAKIELSKDAQSERKLRMMKSTVSPSEIADILLKETKVEPPPVAAPEKTPAPVQ